MKQGLHEFLDEIQTKISEINDSLFVTYFAPLPRPDLALEESILAPQAGARAE